MIIDQMKNIFLYYKLLPELKQVSDFMTSHVNVGLRDGRYDLENGVYAVVSTYSPQEKKQYEAHKHYIDVQIVIEGAEMVKWLSLEELQDKPLYCPQKDTMLFEGWKERESQVALEMGKFSVFFPQDAHSPGNLPGTEVVKKLVFKIPIN